MFCCRQERFFVCGYTDPTGQGCIVTIGGKNATTGVPTIAAICMGPVEFDTKTFARRINAPSSIRESFPATARGDPVIPVITSSTNLSSPVPPVTIIFDPEPAVDLVPELGKIFCTPISRRAAASRMENDEFILQTNRMAGKHRVDSVAARKEKSKIQIPVLPGLQFPKAEAR